MTATGGVADIWPLQTACHNAIDTYPGPSFNLLFKCRFAVCRPVRITAWCLNKRRESFDFKFYGCTELIDELTLNY
jgi:hypothetical protein